jgi:hypothetical protein
MEKNIMEQSEELKKVTADKFALDQMYGQCIRELHEAKSTIIQKMQDIQALTIQNGTLLQEIDSLKKERAVEIVAEVA